MSHRDSFNLGLKPETRGVDSSVVPGIAAKGDVFWKSQWSLLVTKVS
jgi:hypothetical protein